MMPAVRPRSFVLTALLAACSGQDASRTLDAVSEARLEVQAALDELKQAQESLELARAELDKARGDIDQARRTCARPALGGLEPFPDVPDPPDRSASMPDLSDSVDCPTAGMCTVKRSALDLLAADPAVLARQSRIMPRVEDGEMLGFKLYGIRPGSILRLVGFKNGDLVTSINDRPLTSLDQAKEILATLRTADSVKVVGERKGEPLLLTVHIVG